MFLLQVLFAFFALVYASPLKKETTPQELFGNTTSYAFAVDVSVSASSTVMKCFKQQGYSTVFVRAYKPDGKGSYDSNAGSNVKNAFNAGLGTEMFVVPQPVSNKNGSQQVDEFFQGLKKSSINVRSVWFQITSPIHWPKIWANNVLFINQLLQRAWELNISPGIYTNSYDWSQITGNYAGFSGSPALWYWSVHGSGVTGESPPNFNDYVPFALWNNPSAKQYSQGDSICNLMVNRDVYSVAGAQVASSALMENGMIVVGGHISA